LGDILSKTLFDMHAVVFEKSKYIYVICDKGSEIFREQYPEDTATHQ
jgi:hypothetical protein